MKLYLPSVLALGALHGVAASAADLPVTQWPTVMRVASDGRSAFGDTESLLGATWWKGATLIGNRGYDKVVAGPLVSSYTGATIAAHNSTGGNWADLHIAAVNILFRSGGENVRGAISVDGGWCIGAPIQSPGQNNLLVQGSGFFSRGLTVADSSGTGFNDQLDAKKYITYESSSIQYARIATLGPDNAGSLSAVTIDATLGGWTTVPGRLAITLRNREGFKYYSELCANVVNGGSKIVIYRNADTTASVYLRMDRWQFASVRFSNNVQVSIPAYAQLTTSVPTGVLVYDSSDPQYDRRALAGDYAHANGVNGNRVGQTDVASIGGSLSIGHNAYIPGKSDYQAINFTARQGSMGYDRLTGARIVSNKVDGFDTGWTYGMGLDFRVTPNARDSEPFSALKIDPDGKVRIGITDPGGSSALRIAGNVFVSGNIGIGVANPTSKLAVAGVISASEVRVTANPADYVFEDGYKLRSLADVEAHIKAKRHLPGIPSAQSQIDGGGTPLSEMQRLHLEKIEELTLYAIEAEKRADKAEKRIEEFNQRLIEQQRTIDSLINKLQAIADRPTK